MIQKKIVSIADLIVLGGSVGIEKAAKKAGHKINVPFISGRGDASQAQTDEFSFGLLEPKADGFRNYVKKQMDHYINQLYREEMLIDKAQLMKLTAPEMTVLVGGMRDANMMVLTTEYLQKKRETLTNDFFVNLLDMNTTWKETDKEKLLKGTDRRTNKVKWTGTRADLIFGSNSQLRALSEVYACEDSMPKFIKDFVSAWTKVNESRSF